jgi:hypothetical protein
MALNKERTDLCKHRIRAPIHRVNDDNASERASIQFLSPDKKHGHNPAAERRAAE